MKNSDTKIFLIIYLLALGWMLHYNLTHPIINDGVYEYRTYLLNIEEGWLYRNSSINSVLVSIWFPAMLQRITHLDPLTLFRIFPPFFYALAPAFVYLISRKYLDKKDSLVAVLVVSLSSYIFFFPDVGRMGVVLGLLAGMIWALLHKKLLMSLMFSVLIVFAHYGTVLIAIGLVIAILASRLLWDRSSIRVTTATLCVLIVFTGAWHFGISHYSGDSMLWTMFHPGEARIVLRDYQGVIVEVPESDFFKLESRDHVTREAFGLNFAANPIPDKIAVIINWIVVGFITLGMYLLIRRKNIEAVLKVALLALYALTVSSAVIPAVSIFYGTQRVYFTASILLAIGFPTSVKWISDKVRLSPVWITALVLTVYGASTSGLIHTMFGLTKSIPVMLVLP